MCSVCLSYVVVMPNKRQALVEYEDMNGSSTAVTYAADNQVYIAGHPAFINYSTSQKISRPGDSDDSRTVNNVLLFTIMNPIYPITTVSAKICVITLPGTVLCTSWWVSLNVSAVVLPQTVVSSYALQEKFKVGCRCGSLEQCQLCVGGWNKREAETTNATTHTNTEYLCHLLECAAFLWKLSGGTGDVTVERHPCLDHSWTPYSPRLVPACRRPVSESVYTYTIGVDGIR